MKKTTIYFLMLLMATMYIMTSCEENKFVQGEILYNNFCANCHMENGQGLKGLIPPLANADYLKNNSEQIACIIRHGMEGEIVVNGKTYEQPMLPIPKLSDFEITNIINFINQAWGNKLGYYQINEVRANLEKCK